MSNTQVVQYGNYKGQDHHNTGCYGQDRHEYDEKHCSQCGAVYCWMLSIIYKT